MKRRVAISLLGLAISFALPTMAQQANTSPAPAATATAQQQDTVDPKIIEQLQEEDKNFEEAYNKHDAAAIAALFTDDAVLVTPHGTFTGRAAIEKKYEKEDFEAYNGSDMVSTTERITPVGNELHLTRRFRANYQSYGSFIRIEGNASPVFVLEGDVWKIRSETVEVTKKEVSTQSPTPTPSNR
jgi:uncharacterized protein (TIGR02246 family)